MCPNVKEKKTIQGVLMQSTVYRAVCALESDFSFPVAVVNNVCFALFVCAVPPDISQARQRHFF